MRLPGLLSDTMFGGIATVIIGVGRLAMAIFLARRLGVEQFGQFAFLQWCVELVTLICLAGLPGTITRLLPQFLNQDQKTVRPYTDLLVRWAVGSALAAIVVAAVTFSLTEDGVGSGFLVILIVWTLANSAAAAVTAVLTGVFQFKGLALAHGLSLGAGLALALLFVTPGALHMACLVALSVPVITVVVGGGCLISASSGTVVRGPVQIMSRRDILPYALNVWVIQLTASFLWSRGELAILKASGSDRDVGVYGIATTLTGAVMLGINFLQSAVAPHLSRAHAQGDRQALTEMISFMSSICYFVAFNAAILLVLIHDYLVAAIFGSAYAQASDAVLILCIGVGAGATGAVNLFILYETNGRFQRNLQFAGVAVLGVIGAVLVPLYGIEGAAATRALVVSGLGVAVWIRFARLGYREIAISFLTRWLAALVLLVLVIGIKVQFDPGLVAIAGLFMTSVLIVTLLFPPLPSFQVQLSRWLRLA